MSTIREVHGALVKRLLEGPGVSTTDERRKAFDNAGLEGPTKKLVDAVARAAHLVTDDDVAAVKAMGRSEDEIFEIVVSAAVGEATREYNAAGAALDAAMKDERCG
jgi:hypothetical protein